VVEGWACCREPVIIPPPLDCHPTFLGAAPNLTVTLSDQFHPKPFQASVGASALLCTPVTKKTLPKEGKPIPVQKGDHLECYLHDVGLVGGNWTLNDQFGTQKKVKIQPSTHLCEPTDKFPAAEP